MNENIILIGAGLGQMQTNCYIAGNRQTKEALVFDPGDEGFRVMEMLEKEGLELTAVLLTHGHFDHVMALPYLQELKPGLPVYLHEDEEDVLRDPSLNLTSMFGEPVSMDADHLVKDGQVLDLLNTEIHCIHVPGHTKGGVCYYFKEQGWLIAGDTLFRQSIGRTDFPTGETDALLSGIREKLFVLPDETEVYPGHMNSTTIGFEKRTNPFLMQP